MVRQYEFTSGHPSGIWNFEVVPSCTALFKLGEQAPATALFVK
jgi:hypothetical protein